jgi:hypothetical protein
MLGEVRGSVTLGAWLKPEEEVKPTGSQSHFPLSDWVSLLQVVVEAQLTAGPH